MNSANRKEMGGVCVGGGPEKASLKNHDVEATEPGQGHEGDSSKKWFNYKCVTELETIKKSSWIEGDGGCICAGMRQGEVCVCMGGCQFNVRDLISQGPMLLIQYIIALFI